jgi:hypothetical protein
MKKFVGCRYPFFENREEAVICKGSAFYRTYVAIVFMIIFLVFMIVIASFLPSYLKNYIFLLGIIIGGIVGLTIGPDIPIFDPIAAFESDEAEIRDIMSSGNNITREHAKLRIINNRMIKEDLELLNRYNINRPGFRIIL